MKTVTDRILYAMAWGVIANAFIGVGAIFDLYPMDERKRFALSVAAAFAAFVWMTVKRWYEAGASQD